MLSLAFRLLDKGGHITCDFNVAFVSHLVYCFSELNYKIIKLNCKTLIVALCISSKNCDFVLVYYLKLDQDKNNLKVYVIKGQSID